MQPKFPKQLQPGDTIGIIAPSSAAAQADIDAGRQVLENRGFTVRLADNLTQKTHFLAGPRETRLQESLKILTDDSVNGVLCVRGGDGAVHLLPEFLEALEGAAPKPFIGYSDITLLQLGMYQRFGWVTFSGPLLASDLGPDSITDNSREHFWSLLTQPQEQWNFDVIGETKPESWRDGKASGTLLGGCLALVCVLLGSPFLPDFDGAILIIEDIDESPRHVDRMLHQLRINGIYNKINGMIVGQFKDCFPKDPEDDFTLQELVLEATRGYDFPIIGNFPYGHATPDRLTLPLGATVRISTEPPAMALPEATV